MFIILISVFFFLYCGIRHKKENIVLSFPCHLFQLFLFIFFFSSFFSKSTIFPFPLFSSFFSFVCYGSILSIPLCFHSLPSFPIVYMLFFTFVLFFLLTRLYSPFLFFSLLLRLPLAAPKPPSEVIYKVLLTATCAHLYHSPSMFRLCHNARIDQAALRLYYSVQFCTTALTGPSNHQLLP